MLNESQELFFKATLRGEKPEQAAISAGLSPKTAKAAGFRMRKHPAIVAALATVGIGTKSAPSSKPAATEEGSEPDIVTIEIPETDDSLVFLEALMNCPKAGVKARLEAAKALAPFQHARVGEKGKKESKQDQAGETKGGKFGPRERTKPTLVASK